MASYADTHEKPCLPGISIVCFPTRFGQNFPYGLLSDLQGKKRGSRLQKRQMAWELLPSAPGIGARQTTLLIGPFRGRLKPKELGQLTGGTGFWTIPVVY
jgi:hypothetical protein